MDARAAENIRWATAMAVVLPMVAAFIAVSPLIWVSGRIFDKIERGF